MYTLDVYSVLLSYPDSPIVVAAAVAAAAAAAAAAVVVVVVCCTVLCYACQHLAVNCDLSFATR